MKRFIYVTIIMAASIAMCTACHDSEEDITPSGNYHPLRGEFPQGTTPYDTIISDISKKYGVYLLYKDVREQDLNREWVSQGTGDPYVAGYDEERADGVWNLPAEHLPFYVNFFNKHIFPNISAEFAWSALPVKIYMKSVMKMRGKDRSQYQLFCLRYRFSSQRDVQGMHNRAYCYT